MKGYLTEGNLPMGYGELRFALDEMHLTKVEVEEVLTWLDKRHWEQTNSLG
jgi:hypothetical protein